MGIGTKAAKVVNGEGKDCGVIEVQFVHQVKAVDVPRVSAIEFQAD